MSRLRERPELAAAAALACIYLALMNAHNQSIDGLLVYRQAVSIVRDHSLRFAQPVLWGDTFGTSKYGIGLSLLYLPGVALMLGLGFAVPVATGDYDWNLLYHDPVYAAGAAPLFGVLTAATGYLVARLLLELGQSRRVGLLGLFAYGLASPALAYARGDFVQTPFSLWLALGLLGMVRHRRTGGRASLAVVAGSLILAVLTRPVEGSLLVASLLGMACVGRGRADALRSGAAVAAAYALSVVLTLLVDWGRFGSPMTTGYGQVSWGTPVWIGVPGALLSPGRGILWQFPLVLLAPIGMRRLWAAGRRVEAAAAAGLAGALFLNAALWVPWWGAWSWGERLFVPALPILAAFSAAGAGALRPPVRIPLTAGLLLAGLVWALPGALTDLLAGYGGTYDGTDPSWRLSAYPPIGAWTFVHRIRGFGLIDSASVDVVWLRVARQTRNLTLLVPPALLAMAALLGALAARTPAPGAPRTRG